MGWNDSRGIILFWDGTSLGESFCHWMERLQGVILSRNGTNPEEFFCSGKELLHGESF